MSGLPRTTFLSSERIAFEHWAARDFDLARSLWGDLRVTRWIGGPFSDDEVRERLAVEIETLAREGIQYWPLFRVVDGEFLGCAGLRPRVGNEALELGVHLRSAHWGRGYASEAARVIVDHAFGAIAAPAIFAGHHPENPASGRILERLGFRRVADELYPPTGLLHPSYRLTGEEWRAARA